MKTKILLIDDREDNLLSIEAILEPCGYQFVKAQSGKEALRILLKEYDFSLILMDVKMPNLNGFDTASLIYERDKLKHIPIIFITANNFGDENLFKGYQSGAVDYIYKPINPDVLRAKVSVFVELYEKTQKLQQQEKKLMSANLQLEKEINERKASEEKVNNLNQQLLKNIEHLESVNQELDHFAFMASHDLQEPLRKIRLFANKFLVTNKEMMKDNQLNDIERIQQAAERMQYLIRDILTIAKVSTHTTDFVPTEMNILVNDILKELEDEIKKKGARVIVDKIPLLHVHPGLISVLFRNLIGNALKFAREKVSPVINIHAEVSPYQDGHADEFICQIFIRDNGMGFDQKFAEKIFGMFTRLHPETQIKGTGLGLALCRKIAEHHKGSIAARSQVNEGTTFILSLPRQSVANKSKKSSVEPVKVKV